MIFKDIVDKYKYEDIKDRFLKLYPDQKKNMKGYKVALAILKDMKPAKRKDNMRIVVSWVGPYKNKKYKINDKNGYWAVHGANEFAKGDSSEMYWGIEFTPWEQWLVMPIDVATHYEFGSNNDLNENKEMDILIHCLWEMTYCGFTPKQVKSHSDELNDRVKKIKKNPKKYTKPCNVKDLLKKK